MVDSELVAVLERTGEGLVLGQAEVAVGEGRVPRDGSRGSGVEGPAIAAGWCRIVPASLIVGSSRYRRVIDRWLALPLRERLRAERSRSLVRLLLFEGRWPRLMGRSVGVRLVEHGERGHAHASSESKSRRIDEVRAKRREPSERAERTSSPARPFPANASSLSISNMSFSRHPTALACLLVAILCSQPARANTETLNLRLPPFDSEPLPAHLVRFSP